MATGRGCIERVGTFIIFILEMILVYKCSHGPLFPYVPVIASQTIILKPAYSAECIGYQTKLLVLNEMHRPPS